MSGPAASSPLPAPVTIGTAGHVDHGKTALVSALTGVDTDRLPEEKARGLTIVLGYAPLVLPGGRRASFVDVPGHERFVRTMVAGATGIDQFLMVIAADDGVMPQTIEHAEVLRALGIEHGVVAITKTDIAEPADAARQARELFPRAPVVLCSGREGTGIAELAHALAEVADGLPGRAASSAPTRLPIDRVFTIAGRGTVVTGTLWSGAVAAGDELELLPAGTRVRVRGVQVHDEDRDRAVAGQRVAVNLRATSAQVGRGDVLAAPGAYAPSRVIDCSLSLSADTHGRRLLVHHATSAVLAQSVSLGDGLFQLRLQDPLIAATGDRVVVRRPSPPDTLGGGTVLDAHARRHGRREQIVDRLRRLRAGEPEPAPDPERPREAQPASPQGVGDRHSPQLPPEALELLERRLRGAGTGLLSESQLGGPGPALTALRDRGQAVRVSGRLYAHREVLDEVRASILAIIERDGSTRLGDVRDELGLSRKSAQAFLEHLDAARLTRRLPDDRRVAAGRAMPTGSGSR